MNLPEVAPTMIVVDDEAQVLAAIADTLEDDFRVLVEESPCSAFEILAREKDLAVIISGIATRRPRRAPPTPSG
jgi:DNA-binding NtrC family response regulator